MQCLKAKSGAQFGFRRYMQSEWLSLNQLGQLRPSNFLTTRWLQLQQAPSALVIIFFVIPQQVLQ